MSFTHAEQAELSRMSYEWQSFPDKYREEFDSMAVARRPIIERRDTGDGPQYRIKPETDGMSYLITDWHGRPTRVGWPSDNYGMFRCFFCPDIVGQETTEALRRIREECSQPVQQNLF